MPAALSVGGTQGWRRAQNRRVHRPLVRPAVQLDDTIFLRCWVASLEISLDSDREMLMAICSEPLYSAAKSELGGAALVRGLCAGRTVRTIIRWCSPEFGLEWANRTDDCDVRYYVSRLAAEVGRVDILEACGVLEDIKMVACRAVDNQQLTVLAWALGHRIRIDDVTRHASMEAVAGRFDALQLLHESVGLAPPERHIEYTPVQMAFEVAIENDSVELYEWLTARAYRPAPDRLAKHATRWGCPKVVQLLAAADDSFNAHLRRHAAATRMRSFSQDTKQLKMLAALYPATFEEIAGDLCQYLAAHGMHRPLEWLRRRGTLGRVPPEELAAKIAKIGRVMEEEADKRRARRWWYGVSSHLVNTQN